MIPRLLSFAAAAVALLPIPALAQPDAKRTLQHSVVLAAPVEEIWTMLTTADGWKEGFGVAHAEADFHIGGTIRTHYDPKGTLGDPNTITHTILAYEPQRMIASKATPPANAPEAVKHISKNGWSVMRLEPLTPTRTRLTITGMGYGDTPLDDQAYAFFQQGNEYSLSKLKEHFADAADEQAVASAEMLMHRLVGSWSFRTTRPDGTAFRGTSTITELFDGKVLHAAGYLGDDKAMFHHTHLTTARDPRSGAYKVWNFNEKGNYTEGEARADGDSKLILDWNTWAAADGSLIPYRVEYTFTGPDAFHFEVWYPSKDKPGEMERLVAVDYTRIKDGSGASTTAATPAK